MGAIAKDANNAMGAMARRRPWQQSTLDKCHGAHGKNSHDPLKEILSGLTPGAPCGPERIPFRGLWLFLPWVPQHFSKVLCCHGHIFAVAPMASFTPFCHGSHDTFHTFFTWLPWHSSHRFAMAPMAFFHVQTAKWTKWPD